MAKRWDSETRGTIASATTIVLVLGAFCLFIGGFSVQALYMAGMFAAMFALVAVIMTVGFFVKMWIDAGDKD